MLKIITDIIVFVAFLGPPGFLIYAVIFIPAYLSQNNIAFAAGVPIWGFVIAPISISWIVYRCVHLTKKHPALKSTTDLRKNRPYLVFQILGIAIALYVGFKAIFLWH